MIYFLDMINLYYYKLKERHSVWTDQIRGVLNLNGVHQDVKRCVKHIFRGAGAWRVRVY